MEYQFSRGEISNRIQEIRAHVAILSKEKKLIEDSIVFLEENFNEQRVTTKTKVSTGHLNAL